MLFKAVFLLFDKLRVVSNVEPQFLCDLSDRQVEEQINLHLACKWFMGLQPEEAGPDHSALCRFRARLGPEKFQQARAAGLVHDRLRILDATHLAAKVDLFRLPPTPAETPLAQAPGSPDPEARFGRKSARKSCYGYQGNLRFSQRTDYGRARHARQRGRRRGVHWAG